MQSNRRLRSDLMGNVDYRGQCNDTVASDRVNVLLGVDEGVEIRRHVFI